MPQYRATGHAINQKIAYNPSPEITGLLLQINAVMGVKLTFMTHFIDIDLETRSLLKQIFSLNDEHPVINIKFNKLMFYHQKLSALQQVKTVNLLLFNVL